jgi:lysozyme family protein
MGDTTTTATSGQAGTTFDLDSRPSEELAREIIKEGDDLHVDPSAPPEASLEAAIRQWRVAKSLLHLRGQVNAAFPNRSKASDGTIGDAAHASRTSDHNPWVIDDTGLGVVTALDITNDPDHGCDSGKIAEAIRISKDSRVKYVISNRRIANSQPIGAAAAWAWRTYTGTNPHDHHCHISVKSTQASYDDDHDWTFQQQVQPEASVTLDEVTVQTGLLATALDALPGNADRPLLERLVDAQDQIAALLASYATFARPVLAEDIEAAARPTFPQLKAQYEALWAGCQIRPEHSQGVAWYRTKLLQNKPRYDQVNAATGAPWWFVGIVHALEASFSFQGHLHNGDPLTARTVNVPAGRPPRWNPPNDWLSSAVDAITFEGFAGQTDWTLARTLYRFEGYNGYAYHSKGINSPYLWSFSNQYTKGKFVRDHVYDPDAVSAQCGAAVMLKALVLAGAVQI